MELPKKANIVLRHDYWQGSFFDASGNNNHGTPTGVNFEKRPDKHVKFSGTDVITVADASELQLTEGTIICYGDFDTHSGTNVLLAKRDVGGINYEIYFSSSTVINFLTAEDRTATITWAGSKSVAVSFKNGEVAKAYKNGAFIADFSAANTVAVDDASLTIGNVYSGTGTQANPLKGVLIYNTVLTAEEIAQVHEWIMTQTKTPSYPKKNFIYPSQITGKESGLVAGYDMKNIHGKVIDKTGNNKNGTITGTVISNKGFAGMDALEMNGTTGYIDIGDTSQTIKTVELLVNIKGNNKLIDFDGGTHTLEVSAGDLSAGGWSSPTYYVNSVADGTSIGTGWRYIVVTTATGFSASDLDIGRVAATYGSENYVFVNLYSDEKSASWVSAQYNKYAKLPYFIDDFQDYNESIATESGVFLSNSQYKIISGTWKISRRTDKIGKQIECVTDGQLRYDGLVNADDMNTEEFELVSGTPTLTKNSTNIEIDAVAGEKVGKVHLTYGA